jgi:hypothetical protein
MPLPSHTHTHQRCVHNNNNTTTNNNNHNIQHRRREEGGMLYVVIALEGEYNIDRRSTHYI